MVSQSDLYKIRITLKNTNYESIQQTARSIAEQAHVLAYDPNYMSPFAQFACDNGLNVRGGKPDDITVLLSIVAEYTDYKQDILPATALTPDVCWGWVGGGREELPKYNGYSSFFLWPGILGGGPALWVGQGGQDHAGLQHHVLHRKAHRPEKAEGQ
ncbi:hypothetical protein JZ751_001375 [Albula glossodonta]|uniref:Uncharacterized protein n=1 Tax=Albula glossodonta TaxID=121402 RepID=A0A8T2PT96_9TELE|nr:hypothetical protein JZ751_001375 [Albula glossodonta]